MAAIVNFRSEGDMRRGLGSAKGDDADSEAEAGAERCGGARGVQHH